MTPLRANTFLADRGDRLGGCRSCPPPPPGGQVRTAPDAPASGAAVLLTQGSAAVEARAAHNREVAGSTPAPATSSCAAVGSLSQETAPADHPKPPAQAGAVTLSEASAFILSLVAAHEGRTPGDVVALLIAGAAEAIGLHSLIMRDAHDVDLADVPVFALSAANRFRGGGP